MSMLVLIVVLSFMLWYLIDRGKAELWGKLSWGKWITVAAAAIGSFALVFSFGLDLLVALNVVAEITIAGQILTGFILMSGSSAVAEIIDTVKAIHDKFNVK